MTNTTEARVPTVFVAEVEPYDLGRDFWRTPECRDGVTKIRLHSRHQGMVCTWSVLFIGPDGVDRDSHGREVRGPVAHLIPNASVISARRVPGDAPALVELVAGDEVVVRGYRFRIDDTFGRRRAINPQLVRIFDED